MGRLGKFIKSSGTKNLAVQRAMPMECLLLRDDCHLSQVGYQWCNHGVTFHDLLARAFYVGLSRQVS